VKYFTKQEIRGMVGSQSGQGDPSPKNPEKKKTGVFRSQARVHAHGGRLQTPGDDEIIIRGKDGIVANRVSLLAFVDVRTQR